MVGTRKTKKGTRQKWDGRADIVAVFQNGQEGRETSIGRQIKSGKIVTIPFVSFGVLRLDIGGRVEWHRKSINFFNGANNFISHNLLTAKRNASSYQRH